MPIFGTTDEIDLYILGVTLNEITTEVSKVGIELLNETVMETVYASPNHMYGGSYENTYGLMDKAESQVSQYGKAEVAKRVHLSINPDGKYPSFYLKKGSLDNSKSIVSWLDNREHGGFYKNNPVTPPNHNFMEKTAQKMIKGSMLKKHIQNMLKGFGYVISRTPSQDGDE